MFAELHLYLKGNTLKDLLSLRSMVLEKHKSYKIHIYCPPIFTLDLPYMHEYITRSLHSIFNYRKDIEYRRSSSILISVIRISSRRITLYECPFNIQRRLGQRVACVTIHVKVSGSSLGKLFFYLRFFYLK